jgi:hypothetical protein
MIQNRLLISERRILRKIFGPLRDGVNTWRIQSNAELDRIINGEDTVSLLTLKGSDG